MMMSLGEKRRKTEHRPPLSGPPVDHDPSSLAHLRPSYLAWVLLRSLCP